jgi:hypothetical protein
MQPIADRLLTLTLLRGNDVDGGMERWEGGREVEFFRRPVSSHRSPIVQQQAHFQLRGMTAWVQILQHGTNLRTGQSGRTLQDRSIRDRWERSFWRRKRRRDEMGEVRGKRDEKRSEKGRE